MTWFTYDKKTFEIVGVYRNQAAADAVLNARRSSPSTTVDFGQGLTNVNTLGVHNNILYIASTGPDNKRALYSLSATFSATRIGSATDFGIGETSPQGIVSHGDNVYFVGGESDYLSTLNMTTGVATRVGAATAFGVSETSPRDLASHKSKLYMVGTGNIGSPAGKFYEVNVSNGTATQIGSDSFGSLAITEPLGLASHDGKLYMLASTTITGPAHRNQLYTVDETTGEATLVDTPIYLGIEDKNLQSLTSHGGRLLAVSNADNAIFEIPPGVLSAHSSASEDNDIEPGWYYYGDREDFYTLRLPGVGNQQGAPNIYNEVVFNRGTGYADNDPQQGQITFNAATSGAATEFKVNLTDDNLIQFVKRLRNGATVRLQGHTSIEGGTVWDRDITSFSVEGNLVTAGVGPVKTNNAAFSTEGGTRITVSIHDLNARSEFRNPYLFRAALTQVLKLLDDLFHLLQQNSPYYPPEDVMKGQAILYRLRQMVYLVGNKQVTVGDGSLTARLAWIGVSSLGPTDADFDINNPLTYFDIAHTVSTPTAPFSIVGLTDNSRRTLSAAIADVINVGGSDQPAEPTPAQMLNNAWVNLINE